MRETRFRARQSEVGRQHWVYGDYFSQYKPETGTIHYIISHPYGRDAGREVMWAIDPDTLGQYIGLKDKNGAEIYEGDVIQTFYVYPRSAGRYEVGDESEQGTPQVVELDERGTGFFPFVDGCDDCNTYEMKAIIESQGGYGGYIVRVIGNIYDNPELNKEGKI